MPLIQGGPPQWIWERTPNLLKWAIVPSQAANGHPVFELRMQCGLEIVRLQFLSADELEELRDVIDSWANERRTESTARAEPEPSSEPKMPEAERPPPREEGVVSDPDFAVKH